MRAPCTVEAEEEEMSFGLFDEDSAAPVKASHQG